MLLRVILRACKSKKLLPGIIFLFVLASNVIISYSNRSLCYINLKQYNKAEMDATNAIHCDPLFTKAWLRRGIACISRNNMQAAYYDLLRVLIYLKNKVELIHKIGGRIKCK